MDIIKHIGSFLGKVTDPIPALEGIALYMDWMNPSNIDDSSGISSVNSSHNDITASQAAGADCPTVATDSKGLDFASGDYLELDKKVYLNITTGFSFEIALNRSVGGDDVIMGFDANVAGDLNYVLIRNSTIIVGVFGGTGPTFSATIGTGLCRVRFNYNAAGSWTVYKDDVLLDTQSHTPTTSMGFNYIGRNKTNTAQAFDGNIRGIVVYNGQDASTISTISETLQAKCIDETMDPGIAYASYSEKAVNVTASIGDSQTAGRDATTNLTSPDNDYLLDVMTGAKINIALQGGIEDYDIDTIYIAELAGNHFGPEASFIYTRKQNETHVAHFKHGIGGATIGTSGGVAKRWSKVDADIFPQCVRAYKVFEQHLWEAHYTPTFIGCIFHLGGNDASDPTDASNFQTNIVQFMADLNSDVWGVDAKYLAYAVLVGADKATVNSAYSTVASTDSDLTYSTYSESVDVLGDNHYAADGMEDLGVDAYNNWYSGL